MTVTAETLPRHELNGLRVRVVEADDPGRAGTAGTVVVETANTLHVEGTEGRVRQVPKRGATFEFAVRESDPSTAPAWEVTVGGDADATGNEDVEYVLVEGDRLVADPARRTESGGDSRWR